MIFHIFDYCFTDQFTLSDPLVQQSVSGALAYKGQIQKQKADYETNGEKAMYNEQLWQEGNNKWFNDTQVGAKYNNEYTAFTDTEKDINTLFQKKHPNTRISVHSAGRFTDPETGKEKSQRVQKEHPSIRYANYTSQLGAEKANDDE